MRAIVLGLLVAAVVSLHGYAAEPDGPASLINEKEALRVDVRGLLAAKAGDTAARKAQKTQAKQRRQQRAEEKAAAKAAEQAKEATPAAA